MNHQNENAMDKWAAIKTTLIIIFCLGGVFGLATLAEKYPHQVGLVAICLVMGCVIAAVWGIIYTSIKKY